MPDVLVREPVAKTDAQRQLYTTRTRVRHGPGIYERIAKDFIFKDPGEANRDLLQIFREAWIIAPEDTVARTWYSRKYNIRINGRDYFVKHMMHFGAKASAEIEMMRRVSDHPHFLTTVAWSRKERFVVYERMDDWITLQKLLQGMRRGIIPALTTSEVIDIASQCASALLHVSERGFAHTDIKTDKVYLHKNAHGGWHAKIGGTGYAFPREGKGRRRHELKEEVMPIDDRGVVDDEYTTMDVDDTLDVYQLGHLILCMLRSEGDHFKSSERTFYNGPRDERDVLHCDMEDLAKRMVESRQRRMMMGLDTRAAWKEVANVKEWETNLNSFFDDFLSA